MTNLPRTESLFRRVVLRMRMASFGFRLYVAFLVVCGIYGVGLLLIRQRSASQMAAINAAAAGTSKNCTDGIRIS